MHFINAILQNSECIIIDVDVNLMHAILQHCSLWLVHDSSIALQRHYLTGHLRLKPNSKCLLIDTGTPLSPWNICGLVLDGSQNVIWPSEMQSASLQNYEK